MARRRVGVVGEEGGIGEDIVAVHSFRAALILVEGLADAFAGLHPMRKGFGHDGRDYLEELVPVLVTRTFRLLLGVWSVVSVAQINKKTAYKEPGHSDDSSESSS